jgi:hypothetical protein
LTAARPPPPGRYDNASGLDTQAVASSAALLAHALHDLALPQGATALQLNATALRAVADSLADCLARDSPGLACGLAAQIMTAGYSSVDGVVSYAPQHYVGVARLWAADHQDPSFKSDVSRWAGGGQRDCRLGASGCSRMRAATWRAGAAAGGPRLPASQPPHPTPAPPSPSKPTPPHAGSSGTSWR